MIHQRDKFEHNQAKRGRVSDEFSGLFIWAEMERGRGGGRYPNVEFAESRVSRTRPKFRVCI